jgi:hypothetical protein
MISTADISVSDVLAFLGSKGLRATILVPTETGLVKSIMDATYEVREYFKSSEFHDYSTQQQGRDYKVLRKAIIHVPGDFIETTVSLYRPETKQGDPRIWISGLKQQARAGNVLALIVIDDVLHVLNMSTDGYRCFTNPSEKLRYLLSSQQQSLPFQELLSNLRSLAAEGWHTTDIHADTGVGMRIEALLGIKANSRKDPDFKGIEIKSSRRIRSSERVTLFSKTPDWKLSKFHGGVTARELVMEVGSDVMSDEEIHHIQGDIVGESVGYSKLRQYYATVYPNPNPQGVFSKLGNRDGIFTFETFVESSGCLLNCWKVDSLQSALAKKHKETVFIDVHSEKANGRERFLLKSLTYRSGPILANLPVVLSNGDVTLDYTVSIKPNGRIRDHGYLFRMAHNKLDILFAKSQQFQLLDTADYLKYYR